MSLLLMQQLTAQQVQVKGKVLSEDGTEIPGVTILMLDPKTGIQRSFLSDSLGSFALTDVSIRTRYNLFFTHVSYRPDSLIGFMVASAEKSSLLIRLSSRTNDLEAVEVVAVGYGTVKKSDLTGAVSTVKMEDLDNIPVPRVDQMLAGRIAGAEFMSTDGTPGSGTTVRIRGTRSISADNEPLYIVDGVMDGINNLNDLNPADIASISVLKDASSTAIYGSRGANGVIIITTKSGKDRNGRADITARMSRGFAKMSGYLDLMNATEFAQLINDRYYYSSTANRTKPLEDYPYPDPLSLGTGSDWQKALTRTAPFTNYSLSVTGGSANTRYFISGGYDDIDGVILGSGFKRYQFRLNFDQTFSKYAKGGVRMAYSNSTQDQPMRYLGAYNNWSVAFTSVAPVVPIYNEDGTLNSWNSQNYSGGVSDLPLFDATLRKNTSQTGTLTSMAYLDITPVKDLLFHSSLSYSKYDINNNALVPSTMPSRVKSGNATSKRIDQNDNLLNENTLTYKHQFGNAHHLDAMYGFTVQKRNFYRVSVGGSGYYSDETALWDIGSIPDKQNLNVSGSKELQTRMSHLARLNYNFDQKYYLTATLRRDGASNFAANNKWAYFPSVAIRWNIMRESFMEHSPFSDLALRLSAGTSGNDAISRYQSVSRLGSTTSGYIFGGEQPVAFYPSGISNSGLKWEKTTTYNAGLDMSFFRKRLNITLEAYQSNTSDLLLSVQMPTHTGFSSRLMNFGKTSNKGLELTMDYQVIRRKDFGWTTSLTAAHNQQMVEDIGMVGRVVTNTYSYGAQYMINGYQTGQPLNAIYGFQYAGVWKSEDELTRNETDKKYISASAAYYTVGRQRYIDQNNDGLMNSDDMVILGDADPDLYGGWQNTFRYKKAFLSIYFNYSLGGDMYYPGGMFNMTGVYLVNQQQLMVNRYHPVRNPDSEIPRTDSKDDIPNDRFVYDASFLRLKAASLGYNFDLQKITRSKLKSLVLSVNGNNLMLLKNYLGYDPEVNTSGTSSTLRRVDNGSFPPNRTITFTAELKF
ncbi:SusC/RagA family TonB-linked outer membrane protein [Niabella terrae]